ncbi:hypothetical protein BX666DRAFT_1853229 [Dichotomocladium elegans]|nr:hypothetical protein BX666DRAFT_1853229 [Dichotomocladium elegans]
MEARKQDQRPVPKTYYYLDYKEFVDVVKWKMYKMQTIVRDNLRTQSENKGYICPNCQRKYTPLDAVSLLEPDGLFHCETCSFGLEENNTAESVQDSQQVLTRLREQSQPIISLLKQTDSLVIPSSYIYRPSTASARNNGSARDEHELAVAQDTGAGQGEIIVDLQMDNEAARRAKQQEAEEKRQQNMLPVWHQRSTVSDTLAETGERPEEQAKEEAVDEVFEELGQEEFDADRHDYYAKYYESLSQNVPGMMDTMSDADEDVEFETISHWCQVGRNEATMFLFYEQEFIYCVLVNGRMVPLNEVMEEDQRNMTTEEYKAYYEAWQSWQMS